MLQVEMTLEIVCDVVWVSTREGCTDGTDNFLTGVRMKTRYVLLNTVNITSQLG